jgi:phosphate transport system substrate-binding protein
MQKKQMLSGKKKSGYMIGAFIALAVFTSSVAISAAAEIRVGGAPDSCKGMFEVIKEQVKDETGTVLLVDPSSSAQALLDLDKGDLDIATTDIPLESLVNDLQGKGYLVVAENFQVQGIGTNTVQVYLNKNTRVTALSQRQLQDIFTGKITNWKMVGGENQKIVVVWGDETPDLNRLFSRYVIGTGPIVKTALKATDQQHIINLIVKTPGSIGIASHVYKSGRTRNPKTPFVSAKVIAITKGAPSEDAQKILEVVKSFDY